jgi:hypothetical protein
MGEPAVVATGEAGARAFVDAVCDGRAEGLLTVLAPDAQLRALLPGGLREWSGADAIAQRFAHWFGDADLEVVERDARAIGPRVRVRWLLRVRAERLGPGWRTVEQVAYVDGAADGGIARIDLVCTGYLPEEGSDG